MTRARQTLTLCHARGGRHAFISALQDHVLRSEAGNHAADAALAHKIWIATQADIVLSWPGRFSATAPVHTAIARLNIGDMIKLQPRSNGKSGWELADSQGIVVGRMAQRFKPPEGEIVAVRVAAIVVRKAKGEELEPVCCASWELVLPEIELR
jgi:ATP-dependent DNA helicase RecQ